MHAWKKPSTSKYFKYHKKTDNLETILIFHRFLHYCLGLVRWKQPITVEKHFPTSGFIHAAVCTSHLFAFKILTLDPGRSVKCIPIRHKTVPDSSFYCKQKKNPISVKNNILDNLDRKIGFTVNPDTYALLGKRSCRNRGDFIYLFLVSLFPG